MSTPTSASAATQPAKSRPTSTLTPTPRKPPPLHISPAATIADTSLLTGTHPITLAARTIIHPRAKLVSTYGAIEIGEGCVVCERASVGLLSPPVTDLGAGSSVEENSTGRQGEKREERGEGESVRLGKGVVIESGAIVEAAEVDEGTLVAVGSRVGRGCVLGKHCKISPLTTIAPYEIIPDYTVVYGAGNAQRRRIDKSGFAEARMRVGERHVEVLRGLVPSVGARG